MKLQVKFLLVIIPLVTSALLLIAWLGFGHMQRSNDLKYEHKSAEILNEVQHSLQDQVEAAKANLLLLSSDYLFKKYASTADEQQRYEIFQQPVLERIKQFQAINKDYTEVRYILPGGFEEIRSTVGSIPNLQEEELGSEFFLWGKKTPQGEVGATVLKNPDTGEYVYYFITPIYLADTSIEYKTSLRGYLSITMSLEGFKVQAAKIASQGAVDIDIKFGNLTLSSHYASALPSPAHLLPHSDDEGLLKLMPLMDGLSANVFLPYAVFEDEYDAFITDLSGTVLIVILLVSVVIFLMFRFLVVERLALLERSTQNIGDQNEISIHQFDTPDEIGYLSRALQGMAKTITDNSQKINWLAHRDSLTELPNRRYFLDLLERELAKAKRNNAKLALVFLDLDNFKVINDTLGHYHGDLLLRAVAHRIKETLRIEDLLSLPENGIVSRMGGDEFTIVLSDLKRPENAAVFASRLMAQFSRPFILEKETVDVGCSMGITIYPNDGDNVPDLIKAADLAMYKAKKSPTGSYEYFTPELNHLMLQRIVMERRLRQAIKEGQFVLYYQPQVDFRTGRIVGLESLIRWIHPEDGLISPLEFIPLAEEIGLIREIGSWVITEACRQARIWSDIFPVPVKVSVNISSLQFDGQLAPFIAAELACLELLPEWFGVEITESVLLSASDENKRILESIQALGVKVALDDFGTGYASLSYLLNFPVDYIKIDRSFVMDLEQNAQNIALFSAIVALGHAVDKDVIAEGVEEIGQLEILREAGCALAQGYYYSKPVVAEDAEAFVLNNLNARIEDYAG